MVVFLSIWKVMVLGLAGSCPKFCLSLEVCDCPTVRVKELFSTEAILPDTDCSCGAFGSLDEPGTAAPTIVVGGKAQTGAMRVRHARVGRNTRQTFFIFEASSEFGPSIISLQCICHACHVRWKTLYPQPNVEFKRRAGNLLHPAAWVLEREISSSSISNFASSCSNCFGHWIGSCGDFRRKELRASMIFEQSRSLYFAADFESGAG